MEIGAEQETDVVIVGFGPVGQALAALLGRAGHRVVAVERHAEIYRLPRAVHLDHEIMRLLQRLGLAEELADELLPFDDYVWFGADREPLMTLRSPSPAASGWEADYMFFQPALEQALERAATDEPTVEVHRGWEAEALQDDGHGVTLRIRAATGERRTIRARYVVGADGANSFVREARRIARRDLGFRERWLVVDVEPHDMDAVDLPIACQWCDPARPTTHVKSGPRHRRWEFMLLPGEETADFEDPARAWALLAPWFAPADGTLVRHTVYEFRSMLAERTRDGRSLLVGDAAHLTPPFLGQGLCSGLRDAAGLAWRLDLVLRGLADAALLDTIDPERGPQNEWIITMATELGRVLCQLDPEEAAQRDTAMRGLEAPPALEMPAYPAGAVRAGDALAGTLAVQGRVAGPDGEGLLDDVVGTGFVLLAADGDPTIALDAPRRAVLDALGVRPVSLDPTVPGGVRDADGRLGAWLAEHAVHAVLVRPDFYVLGSVAAAADLPALVDDLRTLLPHPTPVPAGS